VKKDNVGYNHTQTKNQLGMGRTYFNIDHTFNLLEKNLYFNIIKTDIMCTFKYIYKHVVLINVEYSLSKKIKRTGYF